MVYLGETHHLFAQNIPSVGVKHTICSPKWCTLFPKGLHHIPKRATLYRIKGDTIRSRGCSPSIWRQYIFYFDRNREQIKKIIFPKYSGIIFHNDSTISFYSSNNYFSPFSHITVHFSNRKSLRFSVGRYADKGKTGVWRNRISNLSFWYVPAECRHHNKLIRNDWCI